jgi:hypothetical protein
MTVTHLHDIEMILSPETEQERLIMEDAEWREGVLWGQPRYGHPEGQVVLHIREVLDNVDKATTDPEMRRRLRLIAIIHDTFKHKEDRSYPRKITKHHAYFAYRFARKYVTEQSVLNAILMHDNAYYAWLALHAELQSVSNKFLTQVQRRMGKDMQLYYLFFKCDTLTGDKTLEPLYWFEKTALNIEIKEF